MKIRKEVTVPTSIVEGVEDKQIVKARHNIFGEAPIIAEEEQANSGSHGNSKGVQCYNRNKLGHYGSIKKLLLNMRLFWSKLS